MPLSLANMATEYTVRKIGCDSEEKKRLENLGFVIGSQIMVINQNKGDIIVNVKDSRIAISEETAQNIFV